MTNQDMMKQDMTNAIYLGDIDPNNSILPVMAIRRILMFQLLIWDRIVLSDSQLLTDPRLNILMGGYQGDEACRKYGIADVSDSLKGVEVLFEKGLIEVALRRNARGESDLLNTWQSMSRSEKKVPYLPEDKNYVNHLKSIPFHTRTYQTSNMASLFQNRLETGLETDPLHGGLILNNNDTEIELKRMFRENAPLFRNILDFLREQTGKGKLSLDRYQRLYDYVYGCYSVNVPTVIGCNVNTKFAHIPLHIESGREFQGRNPTADQVDRLRPTWALNPAFLDHLTFEEFAQIRSRLDNKEVREFLLGAVESPWKDVEGAWAAFTRQLEDSIMVAMLRKQNVLGARVIEELGGDKFVAKPRQYAITTSSWEVVKSLIPYVPFVGPAFGKILEVKDLTTNLCDSVVTLSSLDQKEALAKDYANISDFLSRNTRVITRYDDPSAT